MNTIPLLVALAFSLLVAPLAAEAQPARKIPRIGVLSPASPPHPPIDAFRQGLRDLGYVEGQTVLLEYRYADWQFDRLPTLAAELVQLAPDIIFTYTANGTLAAKQATTTIPIVVAAAGDLVELGIVASLAQPGGNITGQILRDHELAGKRLEMLKDAAPTVTHVAILTDPNIPGSNHIPSAFETEARTLGVRLQRVDVGAPKAIDAALATIAANGAEALMIQDSSMFNAHRQYILDFARTYRLPTVCGIRSYAEAGCLIAYAPDILAMFRRAAYYVDRILKGAKPADLPVELPAHFELVINLKTAQALGLTISPTLLFQADEVLR
jgi:putative ABC transport system substrate-binding protein